jgi:hypothetical protein
MTLRDHFHPPLSTRRHWHSFPNAWATYIASSLNRQLPPGFFAEPNVQFGVEIDVATFEEPGSETREITLGRSQLWTPPDPVQTIPFPFLTDSLEVLIYGSESGPILIGAIELISPANKDREEHREAFVAKCTTYLQQGVGLAVVDVVTTRRENLHDLLMSRWIASSSALQATAQLYATSYRPIERDQQECLDIWHEALSIGGELPTLPLWLRGSICIRVNLSETYEQTCVEQRIDLDAG